MKNTIFFVLLLFSLSLSAQFNGGNEDGFSNLKLAGVVLNNQTLYCSGGAEDGFFMAEYTGYAYDPDFAFNGGSNDGQSMAKMLPAGPINNQQIYCSSGNEDGFDFEDFSGNAFPVSIAVSGGTGDGFTTTLLSSVINNQAFYCSSGNDDGFSWAEFEGFGYVPLAYKGGHSDGFSFLKLSSFMFEMNMFAGGNGDGGNNDLLIDQYLGYGIWKGITNQDWDEASNWAYNTIPGATNTVTIPSSCTYYPLLDDRLSINGIVTAFRAKRLDIMSGATITTQDLVYIAGELNVWGTFNSESSSDRLVRIYNGGSVKIDSSGSMLIGKQTSGPAITDLAVYSGGSLFIKDGTLEIDDQLNILNGGKLEMEDGLLYTHKYGEGSNLDGYFNLAPLYIAAGATGGIYGGQLKVSGRLYTYGPAIQLMEPAFVFGDNSILIVKPGDIPNQHDCELETVNGVSLGGLKIENGKKLILKSDLTVRTSLEVQEGAELEVEGWNELTIGD